jgi:acyl-CoA thioesterase-1
MAKLLHFFVMVFSLTLIACSTETQKSEAVPSAQNNQVPTPAPEEASNAQMVMVVLGDSLSAGYGLTIEQALPAQLALIFNEGNIGVRVINAGVSGDTSANGLARYDWSVGSAKPDILVIALGANDYLMGLSSASAQKNLASIIEKAKAENLTVILAGLQPRSKTQINARDQAFANIYEDLAQIYNVPLYPALLKSVRSKPDLLQADGLHPTAAGVELVAADFAAFLAPYIAAESGHKGE